MNRLSFESFSLWVLLVVVLALPWNGLQPDRRPLRPLPLTHKLLYYGPLTFSTGFDPESNTPIDAGRQFSSDTVRLHVSFEYDNVLVGSPYKGIWIFDGVLSPNGQGSSRVPAVSWKT